MIPDLDAKGNLPAGVHEATWADLAARYGTSVHRRWLLEGLKMLFDHLGSVGCQALYVDGSFITAKHRPNDYDACWVIDNVKIEIVDPLLLSFSSEGKQAMAEKYRGDIRIGSGSPLETTQSYLEFFQIDRDGDAKGIVKLNPLERRR